MEDNSSEEDQLQVDEESESTVRKVMTNMYTRHVQFDTLKQLEKANIAMESWHYGCTEMMMGTPRSTRSSHLENYEFLKFKKFKNRPPLPYLNAQSTHKYQSIWNWEAVDKVAASFLDGQSLADWRNYSLARFRHAAIHWVRLSFEGHLNRLEDLAKVKNGEGQYKTKAERFKAFLVQYKSSKNVNMWKGLHIKNLLSLIVSLVKK
jgi:hypothetical protein